MTGTTTSTARRAPARERVLEAADRLFYAEGIHAVGIDRIVAESGVAKASIYTNFAGKDAIVEAYLDGRSSAWREHVEAELRRRDGPAVERLLAVFDLLGAWFTLPGYAGCPFINAAAEHGTAGPVGAVWRRHREWVESLFAGLLDEAGRDRDVLPAQLGILYDGAMVAARLDPTSTPARHARAAAAVLVDARSEAERPGAPAAS